MGTDAAESIGCDLNQGNNIYICLRPDTQTEANAMLAALSAGGKVEVPLQEMFWGDYVDSLVDQLGVQWIINWASKSQRMVLQPADVPSSAVCVLLPPPLAGLPTFPGLSWLRGHPAPASQPSLPSSRAGLPCPTSSLMRSTTVRTGVSRRPMRSEHGSARRWPPRRMVG